MNIRSLSTRLLLTSLGWSAFALLATGLVLASAFRESVEARFDDTLGVYLAMLIGQLAEAGDERFEGIPPDLGEPRFVLPLSGWYWMVVDTRTGDVTQTSESLAGDVIDLPSSLSQSLAGPLYQTYGEGPAGDPLRLVARRVAFENGRWFLVVVSGAAATIEDDTADFARHLVLYLSLFAAVLVAVTFVQWRVSLRPLTQLGTELEAVREGRAGHVNADLPSEIAPFAETLNTLINSNHATLQRARQHVGNLAHALKTPLSVLLNDAGTGDEPLARSVREQVHIMQRQVRYYLERAQMAAKDRFIGTATEVTPVLERLHRAMSRLGERRGISVDLVIDDTVRFAGEQQDLEEIVGNLVDNGLKWASSTIKIRVTSTTQRLPGSRFQRSFRIEIADDGMGLSEDQRSSVLSRGKRLDQSKPGSGLGLSIVAELVELYGGRLQLLESDPGGLLVVIQLPQA